MSLEERIKYAEMKARQAKKLRPWYKKGWGVTTIIIAAIALIILIMSAFYVVNRIKEIQSQNDQGYIDEQRQMFTAALNGPGNNYYLGGQNPEVTVIEFGDFACPFCKDSASEVRQAEEIYGQRIKIIFRDYPLHDSSIALAIAARCAGEQEKFWTMHDALFANQDQLASAGDGLNSQLVSLAKTLDIETAPFADCLNNQKYLDQVKRDYDDAQILQIEGTPTWFINNYQITGAMPEGRFLELLDGMLNVK